MSLSKEHFIFRYLCSHQIFLKVHLGQNTSNKREDKIISLKLFHLVVIFNDNNLLEKILEKSIPDDIWTTPVTVLKGATESLESDWINDANCYHLAAKFNPKGLHLLLTKVKEFSQESFWELYNDHNVSPLHVAALNSDSISLWYDSSPACFIGTVVPFSILMPNSYFQCADVS